MIHFTITLETYTTPQRPAHSQYLTVYPAPVNTAVEQAVAQGIVRWIERQPDAESWIQRLTETYFRRDAGLDRLEVWVDTIVDLQTRMNAQRWLSGQKAPLTLFDRAVRRAALYYLRDQKWEED